MDPTITAPLLATRAGLARVAGSVFQNVLVAGRRFSATHDAHASVRSMAQCMAMGQAAGTAAGLAIAAGVTPRDVPASRLGERLLRDGATLDLPADIPSFQERLP